jgi:hypothetical protein
MISHTQGEHAKHYTTEPMISHTQGEHEHAKHYTTDVVHFKENRW